MVACDRCHKKFASYAALKQHYRDQHSNAKWPDEFENKLIDERHLQTQSLAMKPARRSHTKLILALILVVVAIGAAWVYLPGSLQTPANPACANFPFPPTVNQALAEHYHAILIVYANDQQIPLPDNIGDGDSGPCTQPLHVHATSPDTSVIHIESPQERTYTLGDFFKVWAATPNIGGPTPVVFNQDQIFNYTISNSTQIQMFVNGQLSTAYGSLVLQPHMVIVIVYGTTATNWSRYQAISAENWPYSQY